MHQLAQHTPLPMRIAAYSVGGAILVTPSSTAFALPLDGTAGEVASSPAAMFGVGCAVGAVVGGLVVGLVGVRSRRALKDEIEQVMKNAERSEAAANRAEALLARYEAAERTAASRRAQPVAARPEAPVASRSEQPIAEAVAAQPNVAQRVASVGAAPTPAGHGEAMSETGRLERDRSKTAVPSAATGTVSRRQGERGVRSLLQERLGSNVLGDLPVIDRGVEKDVTEPIVLRPRPVRVFDPVARANIIDRRIPRFDESLFPDMSSEQRPAQDMFETAMRAMEDSLSAAPAPQAATPDADYAQPEERPETFDAESYIEYLVRDEMERNRSGQSRRYSRAHLTVFEGTGDLSAARRAAQYRPRHFQVNSKKA